MEGLKNPEARDPEARKPGDLPAVDTMVENGGRRQLGVKRRSRHVAGVT